MARKKTGAVRAEIGNTTPSATINPAPAVDPATPPADANGVAAAGAEPAGRAWGRSFKSQLAIAAKGVTVGVRLGHDWVVGFPEDPGAEVKQQLTDAGFAYRAYDKKWATFTHAPNRARVAEVAAQLRARFGEGLALADYPVHQVVVAFDAKPPEAVTAELKANGFRFRSDQTWNADFSPQSLDFARTFAQSLPDKPRSVAG